VPIDLPKAYALYHLAASRQSASPALVAQAAGRRDALGSRMSTTQLARVNELISLCNGSDVNRCGEIIIAAGGLTLASVQPPRQGRTTVAMEPSNGVYMIPGVLNGSVDLKFLVDTGAADVALPENVVQSLLDTGALAQSDFLGEGNYRLADGSIRRSQTFRIRSLQIGDVIVEDIRGSVVPEDAAPLLGQTFLGKLKYWSIDNAMHVLIIE
jgi:clan AA aspartic protease (TIGR02281 family)